MSAPRIQAVLVLYRMALQASATYTTWVEGTAQCPGFASIADLMVCDNTTGEACTLPADFQGIYLHQPDNPGLAASYNIALQRAETMGAIWLLVLDQDTELTAAYLSEVAAAVTYDGGAHGAFVPKLFGGTRLLSPHLPLYASPDPPLSSHILGQVDRRLSFFNSAAVLRVAALRAIGGFPAEFPLDFLDHAVFHQMQERGETIAVLASSLQHGLSTQAPEAEDNPRWVKRQSDALAAQLRFYARYGEKGALLRHRKHLAVEGLHALRQRNFRKATRLLRTAVLRARSR